MPCLLRRDYYIAIHIPCTRLADGAFSISCKIPAKERPVALVVLQRRPYGYVGRCNGHAHTAHYCGGRPRQLAASSGDRRNYWRAAAPAALRYIAWTGGGVRSPKLVSGAMAATNSTPLHAASLYASLHQRKNNDLLSKLRTQHSPHPASANPAADSCSA
jgi:hypothetical protein